MVSPKMKKCISDAHGPQLREIVCNTMRSRSETVQRSGDFQSKQCEIGEGPHNVLVEEITVKREKIYVKIKYM